MKHTPKPAKTCNSIACKQTNQFAENHTRENTHTRLYACIAYIMRADFILETYPTEKCNIEDNTNRTPHLCWAKMRAGAKIETHFPMVRILLQMCTLSEWKIMVSLDAIL